MPPPMPPFSCAVPWPPICPICARACDTGGEGKWGTTTTTIVVVVVEIVVVVVVVVVVIVLKEVVVVVE